MIKQILLYIIIISFNSSLWGQELDNKERASLSKNDRSTLQLHFRVKSHLLEKEYLNNSSTMEYLNTLFSDNAYLSRLDSISIYAAASPEGVLEHNELLAYKRSKAIEGYLIWRYPELKKLTTYTYSEVSKWSKLISYIEQDSTIQYKNRVLEILQNSKNHTRATIEWRLKRIGDGAVWKHITQHHLRYLRSGSTVVSIYLSTKPKCSIPIIAPPQKYSIIEVPIVVAGIAVVDTVSTILPIKLTQSPYFRPKLAIKTNLLYGAVAFTPNLGVEIALGKRTTLDISGAYNWFNLDGKKNNNKKLVHWLVQPEFRYFLGERFNGHFFGFHAMYSMYNISGHRLPMLFGKGSENYRYQGDTYGAGFSYGYQLPIAKRWNLEFNLGVGYMRMKYDQYDCTNCGELKEKGVTKNYFGPTKAGITLMFLIN